MSKFRIVMIAFFFFIVLACNQQEKSEYIFIEGFTQGTSYHITYKTNKKRNFKKEIESIFTNIDSNFSLYVPSSVISRINKNDTSVIVDDFFKTVFNRAIEIAQITRAAFDITVAPLVNAWGFGFTEKLKVDSLLIDSLLQFVGIEKVKLVENKIIKENERVMLDLNAIAQGYSVDVVSDFLEKKRIHNYLVEVGGEVKTKGKNRNGENWRIGIDKPIENTNEFTRELQTVLQLSNKSLATSGSYRRFYEENGVKFSHTIDPKTGYPVKHSLLSVTVIANDCMTADAYATAFMVLGLDESIKIVDKNNEMEAYFIFSDEEEEFKTYFTRGISKLIIVN